MADLTDQRGTFRLGVLITGMALLILSVAVTGPIDALALWWWLTLGLFGATGIGLLFGARFARVLGGLLLLVCVVLAPISLIQALDRSSPAGADPMWFLSAANAIATTVLLVWMCIRGIQMLLGRRRASLVTVRLVGGVLAIVAANHLWMASRVGLAWTGSWSVRMSSEGTQLVGFPFWPLWHVALLVVALALVAGPRRMLGPAATVLMLLFAGLVPLVIVAALRTGFFTAEPVIFGVMLLPVYLSWWLRDELRAEVGRVAEDIARGVER